MTNRNRRGINGDGWLERISDGQSELLMASLYVGAVYVSCKGVAFILDRMPFYGYLL